MTTRLPLRIAHRGMPRQARENTLASFGLALAAGAQGIELDVHCTADEVVVVHHDPDLAGGGRISTLTLQEIRSRANGSHIPTLEEVLASVGTRAELFVEIKGSGIESAVLRTLAGVAGRMAIHSFDHPTIARIATLAPHVRLGLLVEHTCADPAGLLAAHGARDLWPHARVVTAALVDAVHNAGGRIIPWTVNKPSDMRALARMGVDGICTDDVSLLAESLA